MEYIDGCNLRQLNKRLRRKGILMPPELAARIAADVCNALEYAHRFRDADQKLLRLVHRDISPQNVMMSRDGAVKLIDFGIAKATTNQQATQGNVLEGKFSYMSPEQASGKRLDRRSDIFSVGVVLYEMLLGEKPFASQVRSVSRAVTTPSFCGSSPAASTASPVTARCPMPSSSSLSGP